MTSEINKSLNNFCATCLNWHSPSCFVRVTQAQKQEPEPEPEQEPELEQEQETVEDNVVDTRYYYAFTDEEMAEHIMAEHIIGYKELQEKGAEEYRRLNPPMTEEEEEQDLRDSLQTYASFIKNAMEKSKLTQNQADTQPEICDDDVDDDDDETFHIVETQEEVNENYARFAAAEEEAAVQDAFDAARVQIEERQNVLDDIHNAARQAEIAMEDAQAEADHYAWLHSCVYCGETMETRGFCEPSCEAFYHMMMTDHAKYRKCH